MMAHEIDSFDGSPAGEIVTGEVGHRADGQWFERTSDGTESDITDGAVLDRFGDMLEPEDLVSMLDRRCWPMQIKAIFEILRERFSTASNDA
jgi:hypothetical protein